MKLFLASSADKTIHLLKNLSPDTGKKVLFVPNAADPYATEHFWVDWDRKAFIELGYSITEIDLRNTSKEEFKRLLEETDVLHICGGSVSYLGWILKEKDIAESIIEAVGNDSIVYTGTSAGAMIVSEDLAMFSYDDEEEREYTSRGFNKKGLGLIPWTIVPHCNQPDFTESHRRVVDELVTNPTAVIFLHDTQAIWVVNDSFRLCY